MVWSPFARNELDHVSTKGWNQGISCTRSLSPHVLTCYGASSTRALRNDSRVRVHESLFSKILFFSSHLFIAWRSSISDNQCNSLPGVGDLVPHWTSTRKSNISSSSWSLGERRHDWSADFILQMWNMIFQPWNSPMFLGKICTKAWILPKRCWGFAADFPFKPQDLPSR